MSLWYCDWLIKKALFLLVRGRLIENGSRVLLPFGTRIYKFIPKSSSHRYYLELWGNLAAQEDTFWRDFVVPVKPVACGFLMQRGRPATAIDQDKIKIFFASRLAELQWYPPQPVQQWLDLETIKSLAGQQSFERVVSIFENQLADLSIPTSPAHGDLHLGNIIFLNEQIRLIDWSMYRPQNSFLLDVVHFYIRQLCEQTEKSWTETIFMPLSPSQKLANDFGISVDQLRLLYASNRCSLEIGQYGGVSKLTDNKVNKYTRLIQNLLAYDFVD